MTRDADIHIYRWLVGTTAAASILIGVVVVCLGNMGAPRHMFRLVSDACLTIAHISSEVVAFALAGIVVATLVMGGVSAIVTYVRTRMFLGSLVVVRTPTERFRCACKGVNLTRAVVVRDRRLLAFTSGWTNPVVCISTSAIDALAEDELAAVLVHEAHHVRRGDPLRLFLSRVLTNAFFWLPVIRELRNQFELASEVNADSAAVSASGTSKPLARALLRFASVAPDIAVAQVAGSRMSGERIRLLCEGGEARCSVSTRAVLASVASTVIVIALSLAHVLLPSM